VVEKRTEQTGKRKGLRLWRLVPALLFLGIALLPALPPVQSLVLGEILKAAGFQGEWRGTGGYLLTGLELRGVRLEKPGIRLEGERVQLEYGLTGLFRRELPVRIRVRNAQVALKWEELLQPRPPAAEPQIKLKVDELRLEGVELRFDEARKMALPPLGITLRGEGPAYAFTATLPAGQTRGQLRRTGREFEAWELRAEGEVRALSYWYSGLEGGTFQTRWTLSPRGIEGRSRLEDAQASIVGLTITHISGPVDFKQNVVTANLTGTALGAPVVGDATVDIGAQNYSFRVRGRPKLAELARSYGLVLPVEGGGPLVLEGRGWQNLVIGGEYEGQGRLVNEPLSYRGTLSFDKVFRLNTAIQGRFFDRTYVAGVKLVGQDYTIDLKDSLGSLLQLTGQGNATQGQGRLTLPKPLLGEAGVSFQSRGSRWSAEVVSRPVNLPPIARPFDLSGRLWGDGKWVHGRLGEVGLSGSWDDLALDLGRLELLVGSLSGKGSLKGGHFSADLLYDSDYARFPLAVRQEGQVWRFSNDYARGQFTQGVLDLELSRLPLRLGAGFVLSGEARYARNELSGDWHLLGDYAEVKGVLEGLGTRYGGEVRTPLGRLPLQGVADGQGVRASLDTLQVRAGGDGVRVQGPLELGFIQAQADLSYRGGRFGGTARVVTPWLEARLEGRGGELWADTGGYARLSGPLWPGTALQGRLTLPRFGPLEVAQVPLRLDLKEARIGEGRVQLGGKFPFALVLPVEVAGQEATLSAQGDLEGGSLRLRHPWGEVQGRGAWKALQVQGGLELPLLGQVGLAASADLFRAAYSGRLDSRKLGGELRFSGQGANLSYSGNFQQGKLVLGGAYARELRLRLEARGYDLEPLGVPGRLEGSWSERGGSLRLSTPYGQLSAQGRGLLGLSLSGDTRWGTLRAFADARGLSAEARLDIPHLSGTLRLEGPWGDLQARGSGGYALPYLEPARWSLSADLRRQAWSLEGPLQLQGQGLKYQGRLRWPYAVLGRQGLLSGELSGESTRLKAELAGHFAGVPLRLSAQLDRPSLEGLRARLTLPEGQATLRGGRVSFDLETAPLARAFDQPIRGRLEGEVGLDASGRAGGELVAWDRRVRLDYQDRNLTAFLPEQALGARLRLPSGGQVALEGLGELQGSLQVLPVPSGELRYSRQGWQLGLRAAGSRQRPTLDLEARGPWGDLWGQAAIDVQALASQGRLRVQSDWAQADLGFATEGSRYRLSGGLEPRQYLEQPGTLRLEGEGSRWSAGWTGASLRLVAAGVGARLEQARLSGQAEVEALRRRFALDGDLLYTGQAISGALGVRAEQVALVLEGMGEGLEARGEAFGVAVDARSDLQGRLSGNLRYQKAFGRARLEASARLAGTLSRPEAEGTGRVLGEGAAIGLRFGYGGQPWLEAQGAGLNLVYRQGRVDLALDADLGPFTGLPVRLESSAQGPLEGLVLPLRLSGEGLEAHGQVALQGLEGTLQGLYRGQGFFLRYKESLSLNLSGPYLRGEARWQDGGAGGQLDVDLPIPGGRLVGQADLGRGTVRLVGREGWRGNLSAELLGGYSTDAEVRLGGELSGPLQLQARLIVRPFSREVRGEARVGLEGWGALGLVGQGRTVAVGGLEGLEPLRASLDLEKLSATWRYEGALPRGLGRLEAQGVVPLQGELSGRLGYRYEVLRTHVEAGATLGGTLAQPVLEGTGRVLGEGAVIGLRFGYGGQPWLEAQGAGLSLSYRAGAVGLELDADLGPFTGLPVRLKSSAQGPLEGLVLPVKMSGEGLEARGQVRPVGLEASLEGSYRGQRFALRYDKQLQAELKGPYLSGQARIGGSRPDGLLAVDLPIPGGRLVGEADLGRGTVRLVGREGWRGNLSALLLGDYSANPTVQIDGDLEGPLGFQARLRARPAQRELEGEAKVSLPEWGAARLVGRGRQVEVQGLEALAPLRVTLDLQTLGARWSYDGELPRGLGELEARGVYPGQWLQGRWSLYGKTLELRSQGQQVLAQGQGLSARVSTAGLEGRLQGFSYGEVTLDGQVEGPWSRLGLDLGWKALGRSGRLQGSYAGGRLEATLRGDLAGQVAYGQGWSGELKLREGTLTLSGEKPIPTVQARAFGLTASLEYPRLRLSTGGGPGLEVDLATRQATGGLRQWGVSFAGQERSVIASYPLGEGQLRAALNLEDLAVELTAPGLGEGRLEYRQGRLAGWLEAALYGLELRLEGSGDRVTFSGQHAATEWLPWKQGRLEGSVGLGGAWRLDYRAAQGEEALRVQGQGAEGRLEAEGQWVRGNLAYGGAGAGWNGRLDLDLPLEPISARLKLELRAQQELRARGSVAGASGEIDLEASLGREGPVAQATLKEVLIQELPLLSDRVPFLRGRVTGRASYRPERLELVLQSQGLEVSSEEDPLDIDSLERRTRQERRGLPFKLAARYQGGGVEGDLELGNSQASVRRMGDELDVQVRAQAFPLHWLVSAWAGTLDGEATWTGEANLRYNLKDFWKSRGTLIGQALRFSSSKESLQGQAVFRFADERLYVERLQLDGAGSWRGEGYLGRRGSDFELRLENTTFTPVLQVIPQLRPYVPEGSGTVLLAVRDEQLSLDLEDFKFKLGPVAAETPRARLRIGQSAQAEGKLRLTAPYPAEADLSGSGSLSGFTINARGQANLPLLPPNQPFTLTFGYPGYTINAELPNQSARLYLSLFPNLAGALVGELPVAYPRYFLKSGQVYAGVNIQQEQGIYKLNGTIEVLRAELGLPPGETEVSIPAAPEPSPSTPAPRSAVEFVNLRVQASRGVLIQEPLLNGELAGDVYLNGPLSNPYLTGRVVPLQGNIRLWDRNFTILSSYQDTPSEAVFSPDKGILPDVTLVAQTRVTTESGVVEVTAFLKSHFVREDGRIKAKLEPTFTATHPTENRPLTLPEIAGVLIFGRIDAQTDVQNLATSAGVALTNFLVGQIEGQIAQALGLDRVVVTVRGLGDGERFEETTFTFGKYITPELYLQTQVDFQFRVNFLAEYQLDGLRIRFGLDNLGSAYPNLNFGLGYLFTPNFGLDLSLRSEQQGGQTDNRFGIGLQFRF
jgi:hypothetical protein